MNTSSVTANLDRVLRPIGFTRRKRVWNRRHAFGVDVIGLQTSKSGNRFTVNVGVLDADVYRDCSGEEVPEFVQTVECAVTARLGQLVDGRDTWWQLGDDTASGEATRKVSEVALPFLDGMRTHEAQAEWLQREGAKRRYPPPIIALAVLKSRAGKTAEACALLAELAERSSGWRPRIESVARRLRCS